MAVPAHDSRDYAFAKHFNLPIVPLVEDCDVSGECADEIFGGYPWFFRDDALNSNTFPWSIALSERQHLLHVDIAKKINLKEYIDFRYNENFICTFST